MFFFLTFQFIDRRFKRKVISSNFVKGDVHDVEESITSGYVQGKPTISLKIRGKIGKKKANPKHTTNGYKDLTLDQKWHDISTIAKKEIDKLKKKILLQIWLQTMQKHMLQSSPD